MKLQANEVWLSQSTGNYFRINAIEGEQVSVTRLGHVENIGQLSERSYLSRKSMDAAPYFWHLSSFTKDLRRVARNAAKFEAWLNQNAANKELAA